MIVCICNELVLRKYNRLQKTSGYSYNSNYIVVDISILAQSLD